MKLILTLTISILAVFVLTSNNLISFAQVAPSATLPAAGTIPQNSGVSEGTSLIKAVSNIIKWALGFIGIVIFLIFLFAGFEYATAGGDDAKSQAASKRMSNAIIGLIIVFFAFVLSNTVLGFVFQVSNTSTGTSPTKTTGTGGTNTTR